MISAVGVRNLIENQVDFTKSRNVLVAALILVLTLGINYSTAGAIVLDFGTIVISLSGLAIGSLVGIIMNAILPGKDYDFDAREADGSISAAATTVPPQSSAHPMTREGAEEVEKLE